MSGIGIIGTGSMGSMLARKFIETGVILPDYVTAYNRTPEKLKILAEETRINAAGSNIEVVKSSDIIFLCVRPNEVREVILDIKPYLTDDKVIVSVASDVSIKNISKWSSADVVRVIPSITSECLRGVSVICFGESISKSVREEIILLFSSISKPFVTKEENMQLLSDITSSSPGIISSIIEELAAAAVRKGNISKNEAENLVKEAFIGTAELFSKKDADFESLISDVSTEGGITAEGVKIVREEMPPVFDNVFLKMSQKHILVSKSIDSEDLKN